MATKDKTETTIAAFSKEQVLAAKKYNDRRDLLAVLLVDDKTYTYVEVEKLIDDFMKKEFDKPKEKASK